ncbi:hypothetical protein JTE90_015792 [Oedothorax gibbosus]|uniref:Uncharacterized protein n=1 Tax=Oedothorax gibbosus TaxID=931172 RepID=A0AAV6TZU6_9ARAC|nr:hypothetical protein JTE90_015792 [Oedothorax gibbosus]
MFLGRRLRTRLSLILPNMAENVETMDLKQRRSFTPGETVYVRSVRGEKVKWFPGRIIHRRSEVTYDVQVCGQLRFCHADHLRRNPATDEVWMPPERPPSPIPERPPSPIPERPPGSSAAAPVCSSRGPPEPVDAPSDPPRMPPLEIEGTHRSESSVPVESSPVRSHSPMQPERPQDEPRRSTPVRSPSPTQPERPEPRRSTRIRRPPDRLMY